MNITERIYQIAEKEGVSISEFSKKIGVSNGYLAKQKASDANVGSHILEKIVREYPAINIEWLITGNGQMETRSKHDVLLEGPYGVNKAEIGRKTRDPIRVTQDVPLYDLEASAGLVSLFKHDRVTVLGTLSIPNMPKCDGGIYASGDSMYPLLKSGDIICYKEWPIDIEKIYYGEMYVLSISVDGDEEFVTVKYIQKSELKDHILLVSQNPNHQPKDILLSSVTALAMVKVTIRINSML